jgi:hypothetical protein
MPELGPYGSVRGALSNERPYRNLRNVVAKYPFERSHRFAGIEPNSGHRDYSRLSCGIGDTQLGPSAAGIFSSVLRRYWPSSGIAVRHELPRLLPIQRCSAGSKTSNTIAHFALDFERTESVCGDHGQRA